MLRGEREREGGGGKECKIFIVFFEYCFEAPRRAVPRVISLVVMDTRAITSYSRLHSSGNEWEIIGYPG